MIRIKPGAKLIAALSILVVVAPGCAQQQQARSKIPSIYAAPGAGQDKFLADVANLPMDQRLAFVQANGATAQSLDQSEMAKLQALLPPNNR
jgi:hypothetical protein